MASLRYLNAEDVKALMPPMAEVVEVAEEALTALGKGEASNPPKVDLTPGRDAFLHAMPAMTAQVAGMKWVSGFPTNKGHDLPYIHGLIVLNDIETGAPVAVMDATHITAVRTGACSAVTAKHLADPNSEVITIVGCGVQGRANIEALLAAFPGTERMLAFDTDVQRQETFADEVMTTFDLASIIPPEPEEACVGAQILVTSTPIVKDPKPFIEPDWLQDGTCCIALDFDAAFQPQIFADADRFVTDDAAQFRSYRDKGYFAGVRDPDSDLPSILAGNAPGRGDGEPTVLAANLGLGLLDVTLGAKILARAESEGRGTELSL